MNRSYYLLTFVFVAIAFGLLFLPQLKSKHGTNPELLLNQLNDPTRFVTIDEVAERIITKDPSLLLVDVRLSWDYDAYSLPNALNIPLSDIPFVANEGGLTHPHKDLVFYSNGNLTAEQARGIALQNGIKNTYVLKGGLNAWFSSIILAKPPSETASQQEYEQYIFRKSVAAYFGMPLPDAAKNNKPSETETIILIKTNNKSNSIEEEGC